MATLPTEHKHIVRPSSPCSLFTRYRMSANAGGAVYHREALVLVSTTFSKNTAGEEGFAVLGSTAVALNDVSFVDNTFHCARGQYLYEDVASSAVSNTDTALCCVGDITTPTHACIILVAPSSGNRADLRHVCALAFCLGLYTFRSHFGRSWFRLNTHVPPSSGTM